METKVCIVCGIEKPKNKFHLNKDGSFRRNYCTACRGKKERAKVKLEFLDAYDCTCSCCGEKDPRFLTLDHVNDDGNVHRETLKEHQIMYAAKKEGWPKDKYACLCFNCNSGRSVNGGICPHKCITKEEYLSNLKALNFRTGRSHVHGNQYTADPRRALANYLGVTLDQLDALIEKAKVSNGP